MSEDKKNVEADTQTDAQAKEEVKAETNTKSKDEIIADLLKEKENLQKAQGVEAKKRKEVEEQYQKLLSDNEDKIDKSQLEALKKTLELSEYKASKIADTKIDPKYFKIINGATKEEIDEAITSVVEIHSDIEKTYQTKAEESKMNKIPVPKGNSASQGIDFAGGVSDFVKKVKR